MSSQTEFLKRLADGYGRCGCQPGRDRVLLAVSGGADSMALLEGTLELWGADQDHVAVAHLHHGLRGEAGDADAEWVHRAAGMRDIRFIGLQADVPAVQAEQTGTIEETARRVRYKLLSAAALSQQCDFIVTGHQRGDQVETILHHLLRGSGLRGLRGIPAIRQLVDGPLLVRPLLEIDRSLITAWLRDCNIQWRTDETNSSSVFTRNRIRRELLPHLRQQFNSQLDAALIRLARQAAESVDCMDDLAEKVLRAALLEQQSTSCRLDNGKLSEWPLPIVRQAMSLLWIWQSWPRKQMTFDHWQLLANAVVTSSPRAANFPSGIVMQRDYTVLRLFRQDDASAD